MAEVITPEAAAELVKKNVAEVLENINALKADPQNGLASIAVIKAAEEAKDKPRSGVLTMVEEILNPAGEEGEVPTEAPTEEGEAPTEAPTEAAKSTAKIVVETLDHTKPFSMVHVKSGEGISQKHYFQGGRIYDAATQERRKDLEPKK